MKNVSLKTLEDFPEAKRSALEQRLIDCCATGDVAVLDGCEELPEAEDRNLDRRVRAELIRYLLLGGCAAQRPHPKGVFLQGAVVTGVLDLEGCHTARSLALVCCRFEAAPVFRDAELGFLGLPGCHLPGLNAHRVRVTRDILLNKECRVAGPVNLIGARIGGTLDCVDCRFEKGLDGDAMTVGADVFLRGEKDRLRITGELNLTRAQIGGNLQIQRADFKGDVVAQGLRVGAALTFREVEGEIGLVNLQDARLGKLSDDWAAWQTVAFDPETGKRGYFLGGMTYDALGPYISVEDRLTWLDGNSTIPDEDTQGRARPTFDPQPYTQLASVLTKAGTRSGAARVLVERERRLRATQRRRKRPTGGFFDTLNDLVDLMLFRPVDWAFRLLFGYGYMPAKAVVPTILLYLMAVFLYGTAYDQREMAPADPVVLVSADWACAVKAGCADDPACRPLSLWLDNAEAARDHQTFNRWIYGADVIVPLVGLGQETAWAPSPDRGPYGWWGFNFAWVFQAAGGVIAAFGAALLTGAVGRRD